MTSRSSLFLLSFAFMACTSTGEKSTDAHDFYAHQNLWPASCQRADIADQRQSPIALDEKLFKGASVGAITFNYQPADAEIVDDGHTVQYRFTGDAGSLTFEGKTYPLKQFHFHKESEHTLNGKGHDMEVHFVHIRQENGKPQAIALGFFIDQGAPVDDWFKAMHDLPKVVETNKVHEGVTVLAKIKGLNARKLIPAKESYYVYEGSLTTPGCEEFVTHIVGKDPISFSDEMEKSYASYHNKSNRDLQPIGSAKIRKFRMAVEK